MKFSLKAVALGALLASAAVAAPIEVEKRDAASDRIVTCLLNLVFTGKWPGECVAALSVNMGLIKTISINQMSMDFTPADVWAPTTSSNSVVATMLSIPGITLPIDSVRQHIILVDNGVQLGTIETPWTAASVSGGTLTTSFPSSTLKVYPESHDAFSKFVGSLSTKPSHPVTLKGAVDVKLNLGFLGHVTIPSIGFQATTTFQGLNNLQNMKYVFQVNADLEVIRGAILLTSIIKINNPTNLSLKLGKINLNTASGAGHVGNSTINALTLVPGDNLVASTTILDQSYQAGRDFLNDLYSGKNQNLALTGYDKTSANAALNAGLATLNSNLFIPGSLAGLTTSQAPYINWSLKTTPTTNKDLLFKITATFQSPYYGFPMQVIGPVTDMGWANVINVSFRADGAILFNFLDDFKYSVKGSEKVTMTFSGLMKTAPLTVDEKLMWQDLVEYGAAHGSIPVNFQLTCKTIFNNDGVVQAFDLANWSMGLGPTNIAVGADFASILNAFPTA